MQFYQEETNQHEMTIQMQHFGRADIVVKPKCVNCGEELSSEEIEECGEFCFSCYRTLEDCNPLPPKE